jgi:glutamyl-Q tRNA(Asp) synthetase
MSRSSYRGRFAPSPTGLLHAGSLATALASWLDAKASKGIWLIRIEDLDTPRLVKGADQGILQQLAQMGMMSDESVIYQSERKPQYLEAIHRLNQSRLLYVCRCSRKKIVQYIQTHPILDTQEIVYPGFCRPLEPQICNLDEVNHSIRVRIPKNTIIKGQNLQQEVGDFVILRQDGIFTYQLSVVVDDAAQGVTHIVRGQDLESNTPRQIWLQQQLGFTLPEYLHIPLVVNDSAEKLSKQTKAPIIWPQNSQEALNHLYQASCHLELGLTKPHITMTVSEWLIQAVMAWKNRREQRLGFFNTTQ